MPFTYILYSKSAERYYTGSCGELQKRIDRHNAGKNPSTKYGVPWEVVWHAAFESLSEARQLERKIKKRGAERFLNELKKTTD